ncbi:AAA family ATPase [Aquipseudomonas alcaligenes]|uniref:AAA family ATPase n=1 Tax=Aquipseudomonas alcaligenes TaxID=43263 RepID=UPI00365CD767
MSEIFLRPQLAQKLARQLLKPSILDLGLRSGLFMFGSHGTGKTTFLIRDLAPALEEGGALVAYVNLCSSPQRSSKHMIEEAIRKAFSDRESEAPASGPDIVIHDLGILGGATIAEVLKAQVDRAKADIVLIIDEAQEAASTLEGQGMLKALKAARDAINTRLVTPGHFLLIGACSNQAASIEMTADQNQAFFGAVSMTYPLLERDYVAFLLAQLQQEGQCNLPTLEIAEHLFRAVGSKPGELISALMQFERLATKGSSSDEP